MRLITEEDLAGLVGVKPSTNLVSFHHGLKSRGEEAQLNRPANFIAFLAQLTHESQDFRFDQEIWGPTAAQKRYDTRTDLGNTAAVDGDGYLYRGRGPLQVTGRANYRLFRDWCRTHIDKNAPDFVTYPDRLNTDPWEGLSAIWFWESNRLAEIAETGDFTRLTKRINGGYNGLHDRQRRYIALGLRFLKVKTIRDFQVLNGLKADGVAGVLTQAAMHLDLKRTDPLRFSLPSAPAPKARPTIAQWLGNLISLKG